MELYRPEDGSKAPVSISTFEPGSSRWEAYSNSSLHSSRSSLDSSRSQDPAPPDPALPRGPPETDQSIVPQLLIDHYVSMIDPSRAQTVDNDIARHCAFSLPAVALTLGRTNWPLLKETYESLANDMQWKVRRTLASSIHELGVILGGEVASTDLVPIFNGFIKDLDEVGGAVVSATEVYNQSFHSCPKLEPTMQFLNLFRDALIKCNVLPSFCCSSNRLCLATALRNILS